MRADGRLRQRILDIVARVVEGYRPKKVILFGSYAYGEPNEDSDVDLLIIKDTEKRPIDRWLEVKRLVRDRIQLVSVSPLVYTEKEIEDRLSMRDFFVEEILERGQLLYG